MSDNPFFSVIIPTFGRGKLIKPTIESVLDQTEQDYELLVVGDGCTDETEAAVREFKSEKVFWHNLPENRASQAYANNHGISVSRGKWICYLGHDDLWSPDHLRNFRELIARESEADFLVAGLAEWGPPDSGWLSITGVFDSPETAATDFIPPSSACHRRDVPERVGGWANPLTIHRGVDAEFTLRAYAGGMRFASTRKISVHKFTAGLRYLAYRNPSDAEQRAALAMIRAGRMPASAVLIEKSKERGLFMVTKYERPVKAAGGIHLRNRAGRGLRLPPLEPLTGERSIHQDASMRCGDWEWWEGSAEEKLPVRTSWINPRPKILIPFSGSETEFAIDIYKMPEFPKGRHLRVLLNGEEVTAKLKPRKPKWGDGELIFSGRLRENDYSEITLLIAPPLASAGPSLDQPGHGKITVGDVRLRPAQNPRRTFFDRFMMR